MNGLLTAAAARMKHKNEIMVVSCSLTQPFCALLILTLGRFLVLLFCGMISRVDDAALLWNRVLCG